MYYYIIYVYITNIIIFLYISFCILQLYNYSQMIFVLLFILSLRTNFLLFYFFKQSFSIFRNFDRINPAENTIP